MKAGENILITIAGRAGSKGLKNKNIKKLLGKPLMAYSILHAKKWNKASKIICSTDSKRIAGIAKKYGAEVPFIRPENLAGDRTGKVEVLRHALVNCEKKYGKKFDIIVDLDITAPLRKISDLDNCLKIFRKRRPKTLFSVVRSRKNPYFNMVELKMNGRALLCKKRKNNVLSRQKAPQVYDLNTSIYFYQREYLLDKRNKTPFSNNSLCYVMDDMTAFDIDDKNDFKFIEFLLKKRIWKNEV